mmetsp:Transcript_5930/g.12465  ORF Transcript_5930/g.12465 Transcript_5930/m.12465 type:complete len:124 (-) Transcript_5930:104-475(-)
MSWVFVCTSFGGDNNLIGGEVLILGDPCIFVGISDRFGQFLGVIWVEIKRVCRKMGMDVVINEGSNLWVIIPGNKSPSSKGDSSVSGMYCSNSRDIEEGEFCHVCRTEAGQLFWYGCGCTVVA